MVTRRTARAHMNLLLAVGEQAKKDKRHADYEAYWVDRPEMQHIYGLLHQFEVTKKRGGYAR